MQATLNSDVRTYFRLTYKLTALEAPTDDWRKMETIEGAEALARSARKASPQNLRPNKRKLIAVVT